METKPKWQYNEMKHCGVDFSNPAQVEGYDKNHRKFRDYEKEAQAIITQLGLGNQHTVIDMGCGTGAFTLSAAKSLKKIYAVDVSPVMLDYTKQKSQKAGLNNIEFHHGGYLTYEHAGEPVDAIISVAVLHHLPDFWKLIALRRLATMLKPGGKFLLFDVVFSFDAADYRKYLDGWITSFAQKAGPEFAAEAETHARDEYSTFDWIMEGLLTKARFQIDKSDYQNGIFATYICTRET